MFFDFDITVPANTAKTAPQKTKATIVIGTITQAVVFIPPGSNGLAHLKVLWGLHQLFPSNQDGDFSASGQQLAWPEDIQIDEQPAELTLVAWNDDDTYDHSIHFSIAILPSQSGSSIQSIINALQSSAPQTPPEIGS